MSTAEEKKCLVAWVPVGEMRALFSEEMAKGSTPGQGRGAARHGGPRQPRHQRATPGAGHGRRGGGHTNSSSNDLVPRWKGFQLVGDSLMSRVAQRVARARPVFNHKLRAKQMGLIVHGQTVGQLLKCLKEDRCPKFGKKILLTIGTNNILKDVPVATTMESLQKVISRMTFPGQKLILTTVPPIPCLSDCPQRLKNLTDLNNLIKAIPLSSSLTIVDVGPKFMNGESINTDLFESDNLHFNRRGVDAFTSAVEDAMKAQIVQD